MRSETLFVMATILASSNTAQLKFVKFVFIALVFIACFLFLRKLCIEGGRAHKGKATLDGLHATPVSFRLLSSETCGVGLGVWYAVLLESLTFYTAHR